MNILIFGLNYAPELTGIGKYTGEMAAWLSERGHAVRVVTAPPYYPAWKIREEYQGRGYVTEGGGPAGDGVGEPLVFRCPLYVPEKVNGMERVRHLCSFVASALPVLLREVLMPRNGQGPDVVWTVEPTFFGAPLALAAASLALAPAWLHVQDFEVDAAFDLGMLPANGPVHGAAIALEQIFSRAFHRVSSISVRMVQRSLRKGVKPERIVLFPNWVDIGLVKPSAPGVPNRFRQELGLDGKVVLLYSGNMGNKQGLEILPALASELRDDPSIHLLFCGDGAFRPNLIEQVGGLANVSLLPLQPLESLNELLNCADVHLLPQREDAADLVMPSKLTGMLSSGRPTIVTAAPETQVAAVVGGLPGGVSQGHDACGMVVPCGDLPALARAVRRLASDPQLREQLGDASRRYAEAHLGKEQVLLQFERDMAAAVQEYRSGQQVRPLTPFRFREVNRRRRLRPAQESVRKDS